jgi:putative PIN family toxin of toxin-antitoxin system
LRIVLDTNVLVSGLLSRYGAPADVVRLVVSGSVTLCVDVRILIEYEQVLGRPKFAFDPDKVEALLDFSASEAVPVMPTPLEHGLPDPSDEPFLEVAIAGQADAWVSGNLVHYPARARAGVTVLGPADFLAWVRGA